MLKEIVGKTIRKVFKEVDGDCLVFVCDDGSYTYNAEGDCCSKSWVENVEIIPGALGSTVVSVEAMETPDSKEVSEYEWLSYYGAKIVMASGCTIIIDYRNSSNGYYGGSLEYAGFVADFADYNANLVEVQ